MAKTAAKGFLRIELWIPTATAKYANQVAGYYKTKRKLYLEQMVNDHLAMKCKEIPPATQTALKLLKANISPNKKVTKLKK